MAPMLTALLVALSVTLGQVDAQGLPPSMPVQGETASSSSQAPSENNSASAVSEETPGRFARRLLRAYLDEFKPKEDNGNGDQPPRRALPAPFEAPPLPTAEYQGFPLIGVPVDTTKYPLMKALDGTGPGSFLDDHRLRLY